MRTLLLCLILAAACTDRPTSPPPAVDTVPACLERGNSRNKLRVVLCPDTAGRRP